MREIIGTMAFVAIVFTALPASAGLDPYDYPYCLHGKDWGYLGLCQFHKLPAVPGNGLRDIFRTVVRILDLRTYGSRAAGDPIKYGDSSGFSDIRSPHIRC